MRYATRPLTPAARARMTGKGTEMSPFRSSWTATLDLLEREIRMLRGRDVILMIDVTEAEIRLDGKLRADARPVSSGCAVAFDAPAKGPLMFACGRYRSWQDNVRAIALGLEALRKIERYGIIRSHEQYDGFVQIPEKSTLHEWVSVLATYSGWSPAAVQADPNGAYKAALKVAHPDYGGTREAFAAVQKARQ